MLRFPPRKCEGANRNRAWIFHENGKSAISWPQVIKRKQDLPLVSDDDLIYYQNNSDDFRNKLFLVEFGSLVISKTIPTDMQQHSVTDHYYWDALLNGCKKDNFCIYIFQMIKKTKTYSVLYCFSILLVKLYNMQVQSVRYIYLTYELHEQKVIIQKLN